MGESSVEEKPLSTTYHGKSPGRKVGRPKPLKRRSLHGHAAAVGDSSTSPRSLLLCPTVETRNKQLDKEKEMAASFLQYCAMCERQITTPCNSILYCSEACRRKDSAKPLSASTLDMSMTFESPAPLRQQQQYSVSSSMPSSPRLVLPTTTSDYFWARPVDPTSSGRILADLHDHTTDLDPTEWKPKLAHRGASEAMRYLSRFHQTTSHQDRPAAMHRTSSSLSMTPTPSLGNTPTTNTTASSFDSHGGGGDFSFNLRPLQSRQNPLYSTGAGNSKGVDLVTPHIPPPPIEVASSEGGGPFDHDFWGKKKVVPGSTPTRNGLGALFGKSR